MSLSTDGLLCYYTFDSNQYNVPLQSGATILNLANYQYDLSYTGTAGVVSVSGTQTKYGGGSLYNNTGSYGSNYYKCSSCSSMNIANGFTFGCWVYFISGIAGYFFLIGDTTSNIGLSVSGPSICIESYGTAAGLNVQFNQPGSYGWHHVLITASYANPTTTVKIYIDGALTTSVFGGGGGPFSGSGGTSTVSSISYNSQILTGDKSMYLFGYSTSITSCPVYIDEVLLFNRILSAADIAIVYSRTYTSYIPQPPPYPCFKEGTRILRLNPESDIESYVPVETLRPGDLIKTFMSGYKPISHIGYKILDTPAASPDVRDRLYGLSPEEINADSETDEPLYLTGRHSVLRRDLSEAELNILRKYMGDVYVTEDHYRVPIFLDGRAKPYTDNNPVTIWHFALEHSDIYQNYGVMANGILVESSSIEYMTDHSNMELLQ